MKIGLALSGGGIRGAVHIGVLKALEESNINIDAIGGTSSGSLVSSLYACGYSPIHILNLFKRYGKIITNIAPSSIINNVGALIINKEIKSPGITDGNAIEQLYNELVSKKEIYKMSDIKMPIVIPTTDIVEGKKYIFTSSSSNKSKKYINDATVGVAVRASSSFPGIFTPCEYKNHIFVDGGILDNIPVKEVRKLGVDKVIAVNFKPITVNSASSALDIALRTVDIMTNKVIEKELKKSDYILTIPTDDSMGFMEISKIDDCYNCGYETAKKYINQIKNM